MKDSTNNWPKTAGRVQLNGAYASSDGLVEGIGKSGKQFVIAYELSVKNHTEKTADWVEKLKSMGIKMAHPDDGWVNREKNEVMPCYPYFEEKIEVGDKVALGTYENYRIVKVISKTKGMFYTEKSPMIYYKFSPQVN